MGVRARSTVETWEGRDVTVAELDAELARLREELAGEGRQPFQRTSVMTHVAWVPSEWVEAAERTFEGMEDHHPSRSVMFVPQPDEEPGIHARLIVRCSSVGGRAVCSELIRLALCGARAAAPASLLLPLAISDLPVFLRWRGEPPLGEEPWQQLIRAADRVIVDTSEWHTLRHAALAEVFEQTAVSDIAWARLHGWRVELATRWPEIREQEIRIRGPEAEAALLHGWLRSRLRRTLRPVEPAAQLGVRLGGEELRPPAAEERTPSELLSEQLDIFGRDRVYEAAVLVAAG
jgi:hypothetical protein